MQLLEVSGAVRHIYIYIYVYVIRQVKVKASCCGEGKLYTVVPTPTRCVFELSDITSVWQANHQMRNS